MKNSKKLLHKNRLSFRMSVMRKKLHLAMAATVVISAIVCVPSAHAQGKMTQDQTAIPMMGGDMTVYDFDMSGGTSDPVSDPLGGISAPSQFSASLSFSPSPVPEPSTIGLFAVGILTLMMSRRRLFRPNRQAEDAVIGLR